MTDHAAEQLSFSFDDPPDDVPPAEPERQGGIRDVDWSRLPPVLDLMTAAGLLGIGRTTAYKLVRTGRWPTVVFDLDRRIRIPRAAMRQLLGD